MIVDPICSGATPVASAGAANARHPFWNMPGLLNSPMMGAGGIPGGLPGGVTGNFYPQMAAFAAWFRIKHFPPIALFHVEVGIIR